MKRLFTKLKFILKSLLFQYIDSKGRPAIYLGDHRVLSRTIYGQKIYLDSRDISVTPSILLNGGWEHSTVSLFNKFLKPGLRVIDIGAHVGYYALLAASQIGPEGRIYCFEANPRLCELLYESMGANNFLNHTTIINKAVYSKQTHIKFNLYEKFTGGSSILGGENHASFYSDSVKTIEIPAITLDDFFPKHTVIDVIKIDAEGSEPFILAGAKRLLADNQQVKIIMEFNAPMLRESHQVGEDIFHTITEELGFRLFIIKHGSLIPTTYQDLKNNQSNVNILLKR